jgi:hypothetical protein
MQTSGVSATSEAVAVILPNLGAVIYFNFPDETGLAQLSEVIIEQGSTYLELNITSSCFYKG